MNRRDFLKGSVALAVVAVAPVVLYGGPAGGSMVDRAKRTLEANNVEPVVDGFYLVAASDRQATELREFWACPVHMVKRLPTWT